jgi:hypothetical protein
MIQYDFRKTVQEGQFERTGSLNKPPNVLLTALANLQSKHMMEGDEACEASVNDVKKNIQGWLISLHVLIYNMTCYTMQIMITQWSMQRVHNAIQAD